MLDTNNNHAAWVLIRDAVNVMGKGEETIDQYKSKIKRLKKDYKKTNDNN